MHNTWLHIRMCLHSHQNRHYGFTLVEVLVSMMITMIFLMVTLQIFMTAAYFRTQTVENDAIHKWVQADFERVLSKAKSYQREALPFSHLCQKGSLASSFITDKNKGLGGANRALGDRDFQGKTYELQRVATTSSIAPSRLLNIHYTVTLADNNEIMFDLNTRVSIIAAFNCP